MKVLLSVVGALAVSACTYQDTRYHSRPVFDAGLVAWSYKAGANSVSGSAAHKTLMGDNRPCAELPIRLIPDSAYARLRFQELYGSDAGGASTGPGFNMYGPEKADPRYLEAVKTTKCDAQGKFSFTNVADGVWYVLSVDNQLGQSNTSTNWGSAAFKRLELRNGQSVDVTLP